MAPTGAMRYNFHRHQTGNSTTTTTTTTTTTDTDTSVDSSIVGDKLRLGLAFGLAGTLFLFCFVTLTPNYIFCPTFPPLLLLLGIRPPGTPYY